MSMPFEAFFEKATGRTPHPFQTRLATSECLPSVWKLPTGSGKTATAVLTWLWRLVHGSPKQKDQMGRRFVYCLPMRVLVEQSHQAVSLWLKNLGLEAEVGLQFLMGGEAPGDWTLYPERKTILIGTQDMLVSRALNRGYGASPAKWPLEFGLLNNDCFWIMDEVQLMGPSLDTSAQLAGFRPKWSQSPNKTVWMSATIEPQWVQTVDHPDKPEVFSLNLSDSPKDSVLGKVVFAEKTLTKASASADANPLAAEIITLQRQNATENPGTLTLVVINTVKRARELFDQVQKSYGKIPNPPELMLLHSRFRAQERKALSDKLTSPIPKQGRLVVATQVIEAGVDISASLLITELAPWPSLVQRLGRLNRRGELEQGTMVWVDLLEKEALPYEAKDLDFAREQLVSISQNGGGVGIHQLPTVPLAREDFLLVRQKDMLDLFDTTPDLSGQNLDISPYIREGEEKDVLVYWRDLPMEAKDPGDASPPTRLELCSIPFYDLKKVVKNANPEKETKTSGYVIRAWTRDFLHGTWLLLTAESVYPGQTCLIAADSGLYDPVLGWDDSSKAKVQSLPPTGAPVSSEQSTSDDPLSAQPDDWLTLAEHTDHVVEELTKILRDLPLSEGQKKDLLQAARYHDWGKAHAAFQSKLDPVLVSQSPPGKLGQPVAKAPQKAWVSKGKRPHFRHELASAMACLQLNFPDLVTYLVAAHHGKVRQSIRSLPGEKQPDDGRLFARGVHEGDDLPGANLGGGLSTDTIQLSLDSMKLGLSPNGQPSWVDRMIRLRNEVGCFQLGWLEALLRAADCRASALESKHR